MARSEARQETLEYLSEHLPPHGADWAWCEACPKLNQPGTPARRSAHGHELKRRSQGGADDDPHNVRLVCVRCHVWIHANPAKARDLGLLIRSHEPIPERPFPIECPTREELEARGYRIEDVGPQLVRPGGSIPHAFQVYDPAGVWCGFGLGEEAALQSVHNWLRRAGWYVAR